MTSSEGPSLKNYHEINFEGIDEDLAAFQEDEMVQQALHRGVDLRKYGSELEADLRKVELESVSLYVEHGQKVVALHEQMEECDRVLGRMEEMLHGFQADLGEISSEIKHLQDDSLSMNIKLKNRRAVEDKLHDFLDNAQLPAQVAAVIASPYINDSFQEAVLTLAKRLKYLEQTSPAADGSSLDIAPSETAYARATLPDLERLKMKAIIKIREYFTAQFNNLRKPKTNVQMVQEHSLVHYGGLFQFLYQEANTVAEELRTMYVETMGKTVFSLFKSYYGQLTKHEQVMASKSDLLILEEVSMKSLFGGKVEMTKRNDPFSLADRHRILDEVETAPLLVHVVQAENQSLPYEVILRSVLKHLVDSASNEFLFLLSFYRGTGVKETFNRIYSRTLNHLLECLENHLLHSFDCIGILIMIRLTHLLRLVMQRRRIPVLDLFFDRLSLLLWPRFKQVLDGQLRSLKASQAISPSSASSSTSQHLQTMMKRVGGGQTVDLTPHYAVKRYAELVSSISILQQPGANSSVMQQQIQQQSAQLTNLNLPPGPDGSVPNLMDPLGIGGGGEVMIQQDIQHLHSEMISFLDRMAQSLPSTKDQRVFFINNFDMMLVIFQERGIASEEVQRCETLLLQQRELFAEEEIKTFFPRLRTFVLQTEQAWNEAAALLPPPTVSASNPPPAPARRGSLTSGGGSALVSAGPSPITLDDAVVEGLVREFASAWRSGIQQINDDVLAYFANFRNGMEILKQVLTQLLLYYTRFQDLIKRCYARPPPFVREIVSTATILLEIKRFSRTF